VLAGSSLQGFRFVSADTFVWLSFRLCQEIFLHVPSERTDVPGWLCASVSSASNIDMHPEFFARHFERLELRRASAG
jgi:hypothetical protein